MYPRSPFRAAAAAFVLVTNLAPVTCPAQDDYTGQANAMYGRIRPAKRSDTVLLPVLAKMEPPPAAVSRTESAVLLPAGSSAWSAAEAWANAAPQRAALEALDRVTQEEDPVEAMAFGQPYGVEAVVSSAEGPAIVRAGLYTELGDPPMLAGARFQYMAALERLSCLVHVEATRLGAAGNPGGAVELLVDWLFFARQMADRGFYTECRWGIRTMGEALARIRDVAYVDFRSSHALTQDQIAGALERLREEGGYLRVDRIVFPAADRLGALQVIDKVFLPRQGPDPSTFAPTMARLASTQRPLRLFSESARWEAVAARSANWFDQREELERVYGDWAARWALRPFDPLLALQSQFERMDRSRFAVLAAVVPDMSDLLNERDVVLAHLVGTRCALGLVAFYDRNRNFPRTLAGLRPEYVREIGADPFNAQGRDVGREPPLEFFVPIRDTRDRFGARETPRPHEINVFTPGGEYNFQAKVGEDQFVLYSVGPNGAKEWAEYATGAPVRNSIGDLLLWPAPVSLYREELQRTGRLK